MKDFLNLARHYFAAKKWGRIPLPRFLVKAVEKDMKHFASAVKFMSETGEGTDACLELGCLPMPVHFYSPVPDIADLDARGVWDRESSMPGIRFDPADQLDFLAAIATPYGSECDWPLEATGDPHAFYLNNGCFSFGCAATLHCIVRQFKPRRIIEVGTGNSSLVISGALRRNAHDNPGQPCHYTMIEPYPSPRVRNGVPGVSQVIEQRVELTDPALFAGLKENDILFIDSSHTVKIGGDVNFLILEVLPRLAEGVLVHFHDINLPYESPRIYYTNPKFRVFWTEEYLLQAFLSMNPAYEVLLAMGYIQKNHAAEFNGFFPRFDLTTNWANSGSFWIRRKTEKAG